MGHKWISISYAKSSSDESGIVAAHRGRERYICLELSNNAIAALKRVNQPMVICDGRKKKNA